MGSVRWAFPCAAWRPCRQEWLLAARLVQPEEKDRIGQFVFARDAKAALVHAGGGARGGAVSSPQGWRRSCGGGMQSARGPPLCSVPLLRALLVGCGGGCPGPLRWEPFLAPLVAPGPALSPGHAVVSVDSVLLVGKYTLQGRFRAVNALQTINFQFCLHLHVGGRGDVCTLQVTLKDLTRFMS